MADQDNFDANVNFTEESLNADSPVDVSIFMNCHVDNY